MGFDNGLKLMLICGIVGLAFLITLGFYSDKAMVKANQILGTTEPIQHFERDVLGDEGERGATTPLNCNPEIDKDDDNIPDNLDVEGSIDWSYCNLYALDLSNRDLSGANLAGSSLYQADLHNTNLSGADLSHSQIYKANISNTNFKYANLSYANLCGIGTTGIISGLAEGSKHLTAFDFTGADLSYADLDHSFLQYADLTDAIITYTNFNDANLTRVDLSGKDLTGTILREADLSHANLSGTILTGTDLSNANLTGTSLNCIDHAICIE